MPFDNGFDTKSFRTMLCHRLKNVTVDERVNSPKGFRIQSGDVLDISRELSLEEL